MRHEPAVPQAATPDLTNRIVFAQRDVTYGVTHWDARTWCELKYTLAGTGDEYINTAWKGKEESCSQ
jgi:hypothetical protein